MIIERTPLVVGDAFNITDVAMHCRVEEGYARPILTALARSAVTELEHYAQVALLSQTVRVTLDCWPRTLRIALPVAPLLDAMAVTMTVAGVPVDSIGVTTGLRPTVRYEGDRPTGEIVIEYTAGFGAVAADIPKDLQHAINDQVATAFDSAGAIDEKRAGFMSPQMARIAARYRRVGL